MDKSTTTCSFSKFNTSSYSHYLGFLSSLNSVFPNFSVDYNAIMVSYGVIMVVKIPFLVIEERMFRTRIGTFTFSDLSRIDEQRFSRTQLLVLYLRKNYIYFITMTHVTIFGFLYAIVSTPKLYLRWNMFNMLTIQQIRSKFDAYFGLQQSA